MVGSRLVRCKLKDGSRMIRRRYMDGERIGLWKWKKSANGYILGNYNMFKLQNLLLASKGSI